MKRYDIPVYAKRHILSSNSASYLHYRSQKHKARKTLCRRFFQTACVVRILCFLLLNYQICAKSTYIDISKVVSIIDRHPCNDDILNIGVSMTFLTTCIMFALISVESYNLNSYTCIFVSIEVLTYLLNIQSFQTVLSLLRVILFV